MEDAARGRTLRTGRPGLHAYRAVGDAAAGLQPGEVGAEVHAGRCRGRAGTAGLGGEHRLRAAAVSGVARGLGALTGAARPSPRRGRGRHRPGRRVTRRVASVPASRRSARDQRDAKRRSAGNRPSPCGKPYTRGPVTGGSSPARWQKPAARHQVRSLPQRRSQGSPGYGLPPIRSTSSSPGNAVLGHQFLELLDIDLIGSHAARHRRLGVTQAVQRVNHPLPAFTPPDHPTLSSSCRRSAMAPAEWQLAEWPLTEGGHRSSQHIVPPGHAPRRALDRRSRGYAGHRLARVVTGRSGRQAWPPARGLPGRPA